jgi:hypothetical protein
MNIFVGNLDWATRPACQAALAGISVDSSIDGGGTHLRLWKEEAPTCRCSVDALVGACRVFPCLGAMVPRVG